MVAGLPSPIFYCPSLPFQNFEKGRRTMKTRFFAKYRLYLSLFLVVLVFSLVGCELATIPSIDSPTESDAEAARAQTGSLTGIVTDKATGKRLSKATITVVEAALSGQTNSLGRYTINRIPIGQFTVTVFREGYVSQTRTATIRKGGKTTLNFVLEQEKSTNLSTTTSPTSTPTPSTVPVDLLTRYGWGKNNVVRWKNGTVYVYDATGGNGMVDVANLLNTWNDIIGGVTTFRLSSNSQSPVKIYYDAQKVTAYGSGTWGVTTVWWSNYETIKAEVAILPCGTYYGGMNLCPKPELYLHELGHVVGFGGHTNDGGVMDPVPRSTTITATVREMLSALYSLPVGYTLTKAPGVPKDGMAVIPMRWEGEK